MAKSGTVSISGLAELGAQMRALGVNIKKASRNAVRASGRVVAKDAKARAPKDSGNLAAAITVRRDTKPRGGATEAVKVLVRGNPNQQGSDKGGKTSDAISGKRGGKQGVDAFYWYFLEFGTVKMAAAPFMRPAFEGNIQPAIEAMRAPLQRAIVKAGGQA